MCGCWGFISVIVRVSASVSSFELCVLLFVGEGFGPGAPSCRSPLSEPVSPHLARRSVVQVSDYGMLPEC